MKDIYPKYNINALPLLNTPELRQVDNLMVNTYRVSVARLMECAGLALAEFTKTYLKHNKKHEATTPHQLNFQELYQIYKSNTKPESLPINSLENIKINLIKPKICIVCGKGHNGGDGFVAARHLSNWGYTVSVIISDNKNKYTSMPLEQLSIIEKFTDISIIEATSPLSTEIKQDVFQLFHNADVIIDALLGFGLSGPPRNNCEKLIHAINQSTTPVIALDTPSGFDATFGTILPPCVNAKLTLTLAMPKIGFTSPEGMAVCGEIYLADIGIPSDLYKKIGYQVDTLFYNSKIIKISNLTDQSITY